MNGMIDTAIQKSSPASDTGLAEKLKELSIPHSVDLVCLNNRTGYQPKKGEVTDDRGTASECASLQ